MKTFYLLLLGIISHISLCSQNMKLDLAIEKLDSIVQASMEEKQIVGSTYAIVKGDSMYASKSFGYANLESKTPLTNDHQHMFGSISKLITATLIIQLVEEGKLDLAEDIKTYVPYIKLTYPTTLHHLLTHTAGFEEQGLDRIRKLGKPYESLKDYLIRKMPNQIAPPGEMAAYSNHGIALAGLVAKEVTGIPFEDLVKTKVLQPANMQAAGFNFSDDFLTNHATPYANLQPTELQYVQTIPASMLVGTINDLANFMIMQLNPHKYENISNQAIRSMQSTQFQPNQYMYGRGYGFFERVFRGKKG